MTLKRWKVVVATAVATISLLVLALQLPAGPGGGVQKLVVWHEGRADQLRPLVEQAKTLIPGYEIELVELENFDVLREAWENKPLAELPDVIVGPAELGTSGWELGRVVAPAFTLDSSVYTPEMTAQVTADGTIVAVPYDTDIMVFVWNKKLYGEVAPTQLTDLTGWYDKQPAGSNGLCVEQGVWGAQSLIDALGGTPWSDTGDPDLRSTGIGSKQFIENYVSMNSAGDGKFLTQDCFEMFEKGDVPFALVGNWRLGSFDAVEYGVSKFPGSGGVTPRPWLSSTIAAMSVAAEQRGRGEGAQALLRWFSSLEGQVVLGEAAERLPARSDAIEAMVAKGGVITSEIADLVAHGRVQVNEELLGPPGGVGWYDTVGMLFPMKGALAPSEIPAAAEKARRELIEQVARKRGA